MSDLKLLAVGFFIVLICGVTSVLGGTTEVEEDSDVVVRFKEHLRNQVDAPVRVRGVRVHHDGVFDVSSCSQFEVCAVDPGRLNVAISPCRDTELLKRIFSLHKNKPDLQVYFEDRFEAYQFQIQMTEVKHEKLTRVTPVNSTVLKRYEHFFISPHWDNLYRLARSSILFNSYEETEKLCTDINFSVSEKHLFWELYPAPIQARSSLPFTSSMREQEPIAKVILIKIDKETFDLKGVKFYHSENHSSTYHVSEYDVNSVDPTLTQTTPPTP
ncbi:MAG: hypothetical protein R3C11_25970 [Planctomycetaceae bacterium]